MGKSDAASMGRRRFLAISAGAAGTAAAGAWAIYHALGPSRPAERDVNICLFLIDTLRADRLGCYGYDRPTSPNIDALAAESVLFESCSAPAPWTLPSVVSLLTSQLACEHNVLVDGQKISPATEPLAARLKAIGYSTCSLFVNGYAGPMSGLDAGYDICEWIHRTNRDGIRTVDGSIVEGRLAGRQPDRPFHFYIHNVEPHNPFDAPNRLVKLFGGVPAGTKQTVKQVSNAYRRLTRADFAAGRPIGTTDNTAEQQKQMQKLAGLKEQISILYDAAIRQADESLGSVVEMLKQKGLWDNTLFAVISDHGEEFAEHGGWLHDQSVYEELMHVPLLIHFPKGRFAGRRVSEVVTLVDLMPTILDYIGAERQLAALSGTSRMACLQNRGVEPQEKFLIPGMRINKKKYYRLFKESRGDENVVVRHDSFKGIYNVEPDTVELYDLSKDPAERFDLSGEQPGRADAIRSFVKNWLNGCSGGAGEPAPSGFDSLDEQTRRRLRSLGYVD